jgi:WD40 repeat protein
MRFRNYIVLSSLCVSVTAAADVDGFNNPIKRWSTELVGEPTTIAAAIEGESFAVCWSAGPGLMVASVHDVATGEIDSGAALASVPALSTADVAWSPTTNRLAIGYLSVEGLKRTRLFDTTSSLPVGSEQVGDRVAFDATGTMMVVGGADAYVRVTDSTTGRFVRAFLFEGDLLDVDIDSTGGVVGASGMHGAIEVWDMASGNTIFRIDPVVNGEGPDLVTISISPGCTYVGSGAGESSILNSDRGRAMVWRIAGGELVYDRHIANGGITRIAWTDVESELVMLGRDGEGGFLLAAWDLLQDRTVISITPADAELVGGVNDFDFDRTAYVWAVASGSGMVEAFEPGNSCISDLDGDGIVGGADLAALLAAWGESNSSADQDGDGQVNGFDLAIIVGHWGACGD